MASNRQKSRKDVVVATRRRRESVFEEVGRRKFERSIWVNTSLFLLFGLAVSLLAFYGLSPAGPVLQEGQSSRVRIVAEKAFTYQSEIETARAQAKKGAEAPPVYTLDQSPFTTFRDYLLQLHEDLTEFAGIPEGAERSRYALRADEVERFLRNYEPGNPYSLRANDLVIFFNQIPRERRERVLRESLFELERLYRSGIYDESSVETLPTDNLRIFQIQNEAGEVEEVNLVSLGEALRTLRINLAALDAPRDSSLALLRILREGLQSNLQFDEVRTAELRQQFIAQVAPVRRTVAEGETIVEPNTRVSLLALEQLEAYQRALVAGIDARLGFDALFFERLAITLAVLLCVLIYLKMTGVRLTRNRRTLLLAGSTVMLQVFVYRIILEIGDTLAAEGTSGLLPLLPYLFPVAMAPMLIAMLLGFGAGIICAVVLAMLNGLMQGNSISMVVVSFFVALVGISLIRRTQVRTRVVRAGFYSGVMMAFAVLLFALRDSAEPLTIFYRMLTAIGVGGLTGVVLIGFLPFWEGLFKTTTDITLLELTDFNHPLLRRLQLEAPGSYHHSLMVANLSENAAAAIGANPLVCRVCSLFHDIGKMVKPDYFTENQRDARNPHIERNPSMSALVIKAHVKEGTVLAREYRLPKIILDVIRQHHGTTLIQYFYYKALERRREQDQTSEIAGLDAPRIELDKVNEDTYRYEGPRPQFKESAIIMLADSCEAAGRSLRKVTPQSIDELLVSIFRARIEDGQLDECPITYQELSRIRESFSFTLLNMLHARVEYPKEGAAEALARKQTRKKGSRAPFSELGERLGGGSAAAPTTSGEAAPTSTPGEDASPPAPSDAPRR
ncbi:MAG: HD family phosphohydrolase [Opitutales bacterium]